MRGAMSKLLPALAPTSEPKEQAVGRVLWWLHARVTLPTVGAVFLVVAFLVVVMCKGYVFRLEWNSLKLDLAPAASITGREAK